jgi:sugar transferase (PEP-CTERM/EpsH1 system associated)
MRILFLTSRLPAPPVGGDRFRVFHVLRTAAEAGHEVHLVSFDDGRSDPRAIEALRSRARHVEVVALPKWLSWWRAASALPSREPLQAAYYRSARMRRAVADAFDRAKPDVVYTHLFRMAPYALGEQRRRDARWILDLTDVISAGMERSLPFRRGPQRWLHREESRRIARYEATIARQFDECWLISHAEARALERLAPAARTRVVPNGLEAAAKGPDPTRHPSRLLYFGYHGVFHNRDAARYLVEEILPRVRAAVPDVTLDIAGKDAETLGRWARRDDVRLLGFVPDLEAELRRAAVFVAPHRFAAGVQNKVVQALAAGTPVVTTPIVRRGLEPIPDDALRVGADADAIAAHVVALLGDPAAAAALGSRGRSWALSRFHWRASLDALEEAGAATPAEAIAPAAARYAAVGA